MFDRDEIYQLFKHIRYSETKEYMNMIEKHGLAILDEWDSEGYSPAHWVCLKGNMLIFNHLYNTGKSVNLVSKNADRVRPIHWACIGGNGTLLDKLLSQGIGTEIEDGNGETAFILACKHGHVEMAAYLLEKWKSNLYHLDIYGDTGLHWAAYYGNASFCQLLIFWGLDPEIRDLFGQTALHLACRMGNYRIVKDLAIIYKVDLGIKDNMGRTPLMIAQKHSHRQVVNFLSYRMYPGLKPTTSSFLLKYLIVSFLFGSPRKSRRVFLFFIFVLFFWFYPIYCMYIYPKTYEHFRILHRLYISLNMEMWFLLIWTYLKDPGYISERSQAYADLIKEGNDQAIKEANACHTCQIIRPTRSKHCRACDRCVKCYSHHCSLTLNCIGTNNRHCFFLFMLSATALCIFTAYLSTIFMIKVKGPETIIYMICLGHSLLFLCICLFVDIAVLIQILTNLTINELLNYKRYDYLKDNKGRFNNPFNKGIIYNIREYFHYIQESS